MFFFSALTYASLLGLIAAPILGIVFGICLVRFFSQKESSGKRYRFLWWISLVLSLLCAASTALSLTHTWSTAIGADIASRLGGAAHILELPVVRTLYRLFLNHPRTVLYVCGGMLGIFSLPCLSFVIGRTICYLVRSVKKLHISSFKDALCRNHLPKALLKGVLVVVCSLIVAVLLGSAVMTAVYSIPTDPIEKNVAASAEMIAEGGCTPNLFFWCHSSLDRFTDSIMLLEAADPTEDTALRKAMLAYREHVEGCETPTDTLIHLYLGENVSSNETKTVTYPRYWHGYQVFVKPLLSVMTYQSLLIVNLLLQILLAAILCFVLYKRSCSRLILPFLTVYLIMMPPVIGNCLQYSTCYYLAICGMILLLLTKADKRPLLRFFIFLQLGILTAFFDFLTYPIVTYALPFTLYLFLVRRESAEGKLIDLVKTGFGWVIGYGGMWASKWIVGSLLTGTNVLTDAMNAVSVRTSHTTESLGYNPILGVIGKNLIALLSTPAVILLVVLCLRLLSLRQRHVERNLLPYFAVGILPLLWYGVTANHASIHYLFTSYSGTAALIALLFALTDRFEPCETDNQEDPKHG